jgi:3-methyladenine DNA glycosylase AlkD
VAPGSGIVFGVRNPLLAAVASPIRAALRESSSSIALWLAERLADEPEREIELISHVPLARTLADDPERAWQLMRRLAHKAHDWIRIDELAELYAEGILHERFRWAELEQLVYSSDKWERRLVGSTLARLPFELPKHTRATLTSTPALTLIKSVIGDADVDVQKALSWALRSWNEVDRTAVEQFIRDEASTARRTDDGHRAWVLRDALTWPGTDPDFASEIRQALDGVRKRPDAPSTSAASEVAGAFADFRGLSNQAVAIQGDRQRMAANR